MRTSDWRVTLLAAAVAVLLPLVASAEPIKGQSCGDPLTAGGPTVNASDALFVLRSAVGSASCDVCICDVNRSRSVTATDSLVVLKFAVGQSVALSCFACVPPPVDDIASYPAEKEGNDTAGTSDATLQNGTSFVDGSLGLGFDFDGIDDQLSIAHDESQNVAEAFSVSAWIRADSYGHGRPIAQKRSALNVGGFTLETTHAPFGSNHGLAFVVWFEGQPVQVETPAGTMTEGAWHHVVGRYDGVAMEILVDGVVRASLEETRTADASTEPVIVGRNVVFPVNAWDGAIDELRFFDRALTDFEAAALFLQGRGFEPFRVAEATRVFRAEGNANDSASAHDGVLQNGAHFAAGQVGLAFELDGLDDFVQTPAADFGSATDATVAAWIKTVDTVATVFALGRGTSEDELLLMVVNSKIGIFNHKSPGNYAVRYSDTSVNTGEWVFVAGVLDGGGAVANLEIFVNGVQENGAPQTVGSPTDISDAIPREVHIGRRPLDVTGEPFAGLIDEVWTFNRALSAAEIVALYEAGRGPTP